MDTRDDHEEEPPLKEVNILKVEGPRNDSVAITRRPLYWKTSPVC